MSNCQSNSIAVCWSKPHFTNSVLRKVSIIPEVSKLASRNSRIQMLTMNFFLVSRNGIGTLDLGILMFKVG